MDVTPKGTIGDPISTESHDMINRDNLVSGLVHAIKDISYLSFASYSVGFIGFIGIV